MLVNFKKNVRKYIVKYPKLRSLVRYLVYLYKRILYGVRSIGVKVDDKLIVFESFNGRSYSCNTRAVYEYMLNDDKYSDYKFVWVFKDVDKFSYLGDYDRTSLVKFDSKEYHKVMSKAKYWILNYRAIDYLVPKKDQVYVQCWHGTPLKKLGYDIEVQGNAMNTLNDIKVKYDRDAKRFSYLLSPCSFSTDRFISAWNLKKWGKGDKVLELGYPRNDFLVNYTQDDVVAIKKELGIVNDTRKVILYAPTWRDNQYTVNKGYTYDLGIDFNKLHKELGEEYLILFRSHYLVSNSFDFDKYKGFVYDVSQYDDINRLYIVSDMLVTDYSSVFFDYAILNKPILFYMYDLEEYKDSIRGFYLGLHQLPGEIYQDVKYLISGIKNPKEDILRYYFNMNYNFWNDGKASKRLVERVIGNVGQN